MQRARRTVDADAAADAGRGCGRRAAAGPRAPPPACRRRGRRVRNDGCRARASSASKMRESNAAFWIATVAPRRYDAMPWMRVTAAGIGISGSTT